MDATTVTIHAIKGDVVSSIAMVGPDTLELRVISAPENTASPGTQWDRLDWHCRVGDTGTYTFSPSSPGPDLTLVPVRDACAPRAAILVGPWVRTDVGDLAPGRYVAKLFQPFGSPAGRFSYTVPTGWRDATECTDCYTLTRTSDPDGLAIQLFANVVPYSSYAPGGPCYTDVAGFARTPSGVAAWLATLQGLVVTTPRPVTVGGLSGLMVDISIGSSSSNGCDFVQDGSVTFQIEGLDSPDLLVTLSSDGGTRWFLLDRGDGRTLLVDVENQDKTLWDAGLTAATPIVNSFEFVR